MDIDTQIISYIAERGLVRTGQLIKHFTEEDFKNKESKGANSKKNEEEKLKKSERTILRKLKQMNKEGQIQILNSEEVKRYGIEDPDGRAKYLTLRETVERKKHLDQVFELFSTGNDIDKKMVINEIHGYKQTYLLFPSQLNNLILNLDSEDTELIRDILDILESYIIKRGIKPTNEPVFLEKLRNLLEQCSEGHEKYTNLRGRILLFLGYYKDKTVIEQLKKDIEAGRLQKHKNEYWNEFVSKVIEEGRTELFFLENKLRKEGNVETADTLKELRVLARSEVRKSINQGTY